MTKKTTKKEIPTTNKRDIDVDFTERIAKSMLTYMISVVTDRAIPNANDGLKPIMKRSINSMFEEGHFNNKPFRKAAKIVGDIMGSWHPHGDSSIYEAIVKSAQPFYSNKELITFQGNYGTIYGDSAAAQRYPEVKLSKYAEDVLTADLKYKPVNYGPNYDNSRQEPALLPARFPNLLVNGSFGIASGYACSWAPHNLADVAKAVKLVIEDPDVEIDKIIDVLKPDFPTGGIIVNSNNLYSAYKKGIGNFKLRGKIHIEEDKKGTEYLVITEIPYMSNTAAIIDNITKQVREGVVVGITDLSNESADGKIRIKLKIDRNTSAAVVENQLYKSTNMQVTYKVILIAIDGDRKFKIYNIKGIIEEWLSFRRNTIRRIYIKNISDNKRRTHIIEGLLKALDEIDWVIDTIKKNKDLNLAKEKIKEKLGLTTAQTDAIVEMKIRTLNSMQRGSLEEEYANLITESENLISVISNKAKMDNVILDEIDTIAKKYTSPRKTELQNIDTSITDEDIIDDNSYLITYTKNGFVKRLEHEFKGQKRGGKGSSIGKIKEGDVLKDMFYANSKDHFLAFTNTGRVIDVKVWQLPEVTSLNNNGKPFNSVINLKANENIVAVTNLSNDEFNNDNSYLVFATKNGLVKRTKLSEFNKTNRKDGLIAITIREDDALLDVKYVDDVDNTSIFIATYNGLAIRFAVEGVPDVGRTTFGAKGINLAEGDHVVSIETVKNDTELGNIVVVATNGLGKKVESEDFPIQIRGGKGRMIAKLREGTGIVSANFISDAGDNLIVFTDKKAISVSIEAISLLKRPTFGNRIINAEDGTVLGITIN